MTSCTLPTLPSTPSTVIPSRSARSAPTSSRKLQRSLMQAGYPGATPILTPPMPIYEYRCENGHLFEVMQKITEEPVTECAECGAPVSRVFHPIAVHFKGSGFYNTDYGTARRKREMDKSASDGADKHDSKQAEKKSSESKPASDSKPATKSSDS